jgi:hypothetical protein
MSSRMKRFLVMVAAPGACLLLAACPKDSRISVAPGSTADSLVFALGTGRAGRPVSFGGLRVDPCDAFRETPGQFPPDTRSAWVLEAVIGEAPRISSVRYGQDPQGYRSRFPARPLDRPGCYIATISGTGATGFEVDAQGRLTELSEEERSARSLP